MDEHLLALAAEYAELVQSSQSGDYDDWQALDSARQVAHQLLREYAGDDADYTYARAVLHAARGGNWQ